MSCPATVLPAKLANLAMLAPLALGAATATALGAEHHAGPSVLYGGCAAVATESVCYLPDDNTLTLWVSTPASAAIDLLVDGKPLADQHVTPGNGGSRYSVVVSPKASTLAVVATTTGGTTRWQLTLDREPLPAWLRSAQQDYREGRLDQAQRKVQKGSVTGSGGSRFRGYALGKLGRIARRQNNPAAAKRYLSDAVAAHLDAGRHSEALNDASVLAFVWLRTDRDFPAARRSLAMPGQLAQRPAESRYYAAYYEGLIELEAGNARAALPGLRNAARIARKMGWDRLTLSAEQALATQLQNLGRFDDAHALLSRWRDALPADLSACERANFLTNTGWAALLMLEAGQSATDPTPVLSEALRQNEAACSRQAAANAEINLALAHLHAGRPGEAQALLRTIRENRHPPELRVALWWHDIAGRVALASGDADAALEHFDELQRLARLTLSGDAQWRAALRKALLYSQLNRPTEALRHFEQARILRNDDLLRAPMDEGRSHVLAIRAQGFDAQMALLLHAGRHVDAMHLLRREHAAELRLLTPVSSEALGGEGFYAQYEQSRQHMLSLLDSLWSLPVDELEAAELEIATLEKILRNRLDVLLSDASTTRNAVSPPDPPPGQALVALHEAREGWWVLVQQGQLVTAQRPRCMKSDPERLGQCLLDTASAAIQGSDELAFLVPAALEEVAFHTLVLNGKPLIDQVGVLYQIETGALSAGVPQASNSALLVADPAGRLPAARFEALRLHRELATAGGWSVSLLEGPDATLSSVRAALADSTLFHFAGHAQYAGPDGWSSHLALARGETLGVTDILALQSVPRMVVLSGCETARQVRPHAAASIGLAQAFIARGSEWVIATTRAVDDQTAAALTTAFYQHWRDGDDVAGAFRIAQQQLSTSRPASDWAAFRLLARPLGEKP